MDAYEQVEQAAAAIWRASDVRPRLGIVLGSGLGELAGEVADGATLPYNEIPHFPAPRDIGHAGALVLGRLAGLPAAVLNGRAHLYEGFSAAEVAFPVRVLRRLGAEAVVLTNAAGGVNATLVPGALMLIADHVNLTGTSPLSGPNDARLGPRFPPMTDAYDPALRALARRVGEGLGQELAEGVYLGLAGPSFETPAEIRMLAALGADAVGMSTVLETIAARHAGLRVLGISAITNAAAGLADVPPSAEEVYATAERIRPRLLALLRGIAVALTASA